LFKFNDSALYGGLYYIDTEITDISSVKTKENIITNEIISKYFINLKESVPYHVYENNPCILYLFEVEGIKLGLTNYIIKLLTDDCYIQTATDKGLTLMEKDYAVVPNEDDTLEDRRKVLLAKRRMNSICTVENLKKMCKSYSYTDVNIIQHYAEYIVDIILKSEVGFAKDIDRLSKDVSVFIPAHLEIHWKLKAVTKTDLKIASYNQQGEKNIVYPFMVSSVSTQGIFTVYASSYRGIERINNYPRETVFGSLVIDENNNYVVDNEQNFVIE
jgi:hypothetical protein